jgi:glycosyltransferase involved in cell wall biosynthesis
MSDKDTAVLLTVYNRPRLAHDAIRSVLQQDCRHWRLYILDDGCNADTRRAIQFAVHGGNTGAIWRRMWGDENGTAIELAGGSVVWWKGRERTMEERKSSISYSRSINIAFNLLTRGERFVTYLCDDDYFYPESVRKRREVLVQHPDLHVVYGRTRSIQFEQDGTFNKWGTSAPPTSGLAFPRPTGRRVKHGGGWHTHFEDPELVDPTTCLPYVEEGFWQPGGITYGCEGRTDHNQVMHATECLTKCREWPQRDDGTHEFWCENVAAGVGDAAFFTLLGQRHLFHGADVWTCSKRFHSLSDGVSDAEVRE